MSISIRGLLKVKRILSELDREFRKDEYDLSAEQYVIEHFENAYVKRGESVRKVKRKSNISQFDRPTRRHIAVHYIVKVRLREINHEIMKRNKKRLVRVNKK